MRDVMRGNLILNGNSLKTGGPHNASGKYNKISQWRTSLCVGRRSLIKYPYIYCEMTFPILQQWIKFWNLWNKFRHTFSHFLSNFIPSIFLLVLFIT
jgi:hypothetical protein